MLYILDRSMFSAQFPQISWFHDYRCPSAEKKQIVRRILEPVIILLRLKRNGSNSPHHVLSGHFVCVTMLKPTLSVMQVQDFHKNAKNATTQPRPRETADISAIWFFLRLFGSPLCCDPHLVLADPSHNQVSQLASSCAFLSKLRCGPLSRVHSKYSLANFKKKKLYRLMFTGTIVMEAEEAKISPFVVNAEAGQPLRIVWGKWNVCLESAQTQQQNKVDSEDGADDKEGEAIQIKLVHQDLPSISSHCNKQEQVTSLHNFILSQSESIVVYLKLSECLLV